MWPWTAHVHRSSPASNGLSRGLSFGVSSQIDRATSPGSAAATQSGNEPGSLQARRQSSSSMFRPVTMRTTGPRRRRADRVRREPAPAAPSDTDPDGRVRADRARRSPVPRRAASASHRRASTSTASGTATRMARPSANVSARVDSTTRPARQHSTITGASFDCTPIRAVCGERSHSSRPIPPSSAPLPSGTTTAAGGLARADRGSRAAIAAVPLVLPPARPPSANSGNPAASAKRAASALASSKSAPTSRTSAPKRSISSSFARVARFGAKTTARSAEARSRPRRRGAVVSGRRCDDGVGAGCPMASSDGKRASPLERAELVDVLALEDRARARRPALSAPARAGWQSVKLARSARPLGPRPHLVGVRHRGAAEVARPSSIR